MIFNFLREALFGERHYSDMPSIKTKDEVPILSNAAPNTIAANIPPQFKQDIDNLVEYVGENNWAAGLSIEFTLQELLTICPKERKRSDAYRKLIAYLEELGIELTIKRKEKKI